MDGGVVGGVGGSSGSVEGVGWWRGGRVAWGLGPGGWGGVGGKGTPGARVVRRQPSAGLVTVVGGWRVGWVGWVGQMGGSSCGGEVMMRGRGTLGAEVTW